jgi:hypothetical protein
MGGEDGGNPLVKIAQAENFLHILFGKSTQNPYFFILEVTELYTLLTTEEIRWLFSKKYDCMLFTSEAQFIVPTGG